MGLFIGIGQTIEQARNWVIQNNLHFPVLADSTEDITSLFTLAPPWISVIDVNQVVQFTEVSYEDSTVYILDSLLQVMWTPEIGASAAAIDFGSVVINQTEEVELYLDNAGTGVLNVTAASLSGANFAVNFTPGEIPARDDSMLVVVGFTPPDTGVYVDTLVIQSDGGDLAIPLTGSGITGSNIHLPWDEPPQGFILKPVQPNPLNSQAVIEFSLPRTAQIELEVFDVNGKSVSFLYFGSIGGGVHQISFNSGNLPSGIYFCRLSSGTFVAVKKMILLK